MSAHKMFLCLLLAALTSRGVAQETKPAIPPAQNDINRALAALAPAEPWIARDRNKPGRPVIAVRFRPNFGEVRDEMLLHLRAFPELRCVELPNKRFVTDAGLAHLANLAQIEELDLNGTQVTPAGLIAFLKGRTNVRRLNLTGMPVTDDDLAAIAKLTNLEALSLRGSAVTDRGLQHLAALKKLRELSLMSTKTSDAGLAHIKGLTLLEDLDLDRTQITDAGLEQLGGLKKLRRLQFAHTPVTDAGLQQLEPLTRLKNVNAGATSVTAGALEKFWQSRAQGDEDPAPILGEWNSIDRHVAMGSLFQPVHGVRKREAKVYFQGTADKLTGHSVMEDHGAISFQERWKEGRTDFRKVRFADGRLSFEFDIAEWRSDAGPIRVEDGLLNKTGTIRVEARLQNDRLVGAWYMFTEDGAEVFRGEWEASRPATATAAAASPAPEVPATDTVTERVKGGIHFGGKEPSWTRVTGKVKALNGYTLEFASGQKADLRNVMDAPDLEQKGVIDGKLYPCGQQSMEFLKSLIGDQPVTFYMDGTIREGVTPHGPCFIGERSVAAEMVLHGWAVSNHSGMEPYEVMAREKQRGLWRGKFVMPSRWRKGERLGAE